MPEEKYVEVDGQKFVDDGTGSSKLDESGQPIPFVEEQTVPYSRFKEVNDAKKLAEQEAQTLKETKGDVLSPEQQKERQAKDYLKGLTKEVLADEAKAKTEAEVQEQKKFDSEVDDAVALNTDVDKAEFLKFVEDNSEKYGITGVEGAMKLYKDFGKVKTETVEEVKENLKAKPNLPKSSGTVATPQDFAEADKDKSYGQVTEEIIKESETRSKK